MIYFNCHACENPIAISSAFAGKKGTCSACGAMLTIPIRQAEASAESAALKEVAERQLFAAPAALPAETSQPINPPAKLASVVRVPSPAITPAPRPKPKTVDAEATRDTVSDVVLPTPEKRPSVELNPGALLQEVDEQDVTMPMLDLYVALLRWTGKVLAGLLIFAGFGGSYIVTGLTEGLSLEATILGWCLFGAAIVIGVITVLGTLVLAEVLDGHATLSHDVRRLRISVKNLLQLECRRAP